MASANRAPPIPFFGVRTAKCRGAGKQGVGGTMDPGRPAPIRKSRGSLVDDGRNLTPRELADAIGPERDEDIEAGLRFGSESGGVDAKADGLKAANLVNAIGKQTGRPAEVPIVEVMEPNTNLENTLVEIANGIALLAPDVFEHLVAFEESAFVEQIDTHGQLAR